MKDALKIAVIGQKGIPARYGGVETHVEQISTRLAAKGHDVSVYCRNRFRPPAREVTDSNGFEISDGGLRYRGVRLVFRPSITTKHLDAATHSLLCAAETALRRSLDIVHFHGIGPAAFAPIPRAAGRTVVSTVHALDYRQAKWGWWARNRLREGEATAVRRSDGVIAVSRVLAKHIAERYGVAARYIPNGATVEQPVPPRRLHEYGLQGNDYILAVGRIIPDRGLHHVIDAVRRLHKPVKLVIVGTEAPRTSYSRMLESVADERVIFTGDLYGEDLAELYSNCRLYVLASEVEGLPITVCEAMGYGRAVLLSDIPENREVGGPAAEYFKVHDVSKLTEQLEAMLEDSYDLGSRGRRGVERVAGHYNWDRLAEEVEGYYYEVLGR
ncbi:MAG: glycosyltransferase family 4 protein [Candidatus Krumholzibacteriia bacterium]